MNTAWFCAPWLRQLEILDWFPHGRVIAVLCVPGLSGVLAVADSPDLFMSLRSFCDGSSGKPQSLHVSWQAILVQKPSRSALSGSGKPVYLLPWNGWDRVWPSRQLLPDIVQHIKKRLHLRYSRSICVKFHCSFMDLSQSSLADPLKSAHSRAVAYPSSPSNSRRDRGEN